MPECIFCKIARGEAPSHTIWEDEKHLAFLTIFPNTEGFSVVITKEHYDSYVANVPDEVSGGLLSAAKKVAGQIDRAFDDVGRTGFIFEGFGVDHLHVKLFPMHGTESPGWEKRHSKVEKYFDHYEGYISSHDYERADDAQLAQVAEKIRAAREH